uniref:ATP-dependent Clp protease proteolytic subunit n=1 Tax=Widdringtonia schwarzii TaxID=104009 RepID=A0A6J4AH56_9CONI|nr:ATP-dependent Clp protease proteolytic subunit [Widdringtonia schwarzii]
MSLNLGYIPKVPFEEGPKQHKEKEEEEDQEEDQEEEQEDQEEEQEDQEEEQEDQEEEQEDQEEEQEDQEEEQEDQEEEEEEEDQEEEEEEDQEEEEEDQEEEEEDQEEEEEDQEEEEEDQEEEEEDQEQQEQLSYPPQGSSSEYDPQAREKSSEESYSEVEKEITWVELYYRLFFGRYIFLGRPLEKQPADQIMKCMIYLNQEDKTKGFFFFLSCRGGGMKQGVAVYDVMQFVTGDISTIGYGLNASMGAFLLHGGAFSKRAVSENARVMMHQPRMSPYDHRRYSGIESGSDADNMNRLRTYILETYIRRTGEDPELIEYLLERDIYLQPEEAKNVNLIDEITVEGFDDSTNISSFYNHKDENDVYEKDKRSDFVPISKHLDESLSQKNLVCC